MRAKQLLALGLFWASAVWAQNSLDNVDWVELPVPPPPASYSTDHLIPLEMPSYVSVKVGIDPQSIVVGADGIVRYVVVMRNAAGSLNVAYEGIRCASDEVKTYARVSSSGAWAPVNGVEWKAVNSNMPSRHAWAFARQGGCDNRMTPSREEIIQSLQQRQKTDRNR